METYKLKAQVGRNLNLLEIRKPQKREGNNVIFFNSTFKLSKRKGKELKERKNNNKKG